VKRIAVAALLFAAGLGLRAEEPSTPTFCAEWVEQTRDGFERLTLFVDRNVVWKRTLGGASPQFKQRKLGDEEARFYCDYFRSDEIWSGPEDLRSNMTGDLIKQSVVTLTRPDGSRRQFRFDELSALTPELAALRSSLEGLRATFQSPLAPASRFAAEALSPGTVLKRFDGVLFRVKRIDAGKGVVELEGFREPYLEFRKLEELRFLFYAPETR
jgi:hypothetical protein